MVLKQGENVEEAKGYMALVERLTITAVLKAVGGCRTHAAEFLGISVRGLRLKIRQYQAQGFDIPPAPPAASPVPNSSGTQDKKQAEKPRRKRI